MEGGQRLEHTANVFPPRYWSTLELPNDLGNGATTLASCEGSTPTKDASSDSWYRSPVLYRLGEGEVESVAGSQHSASAGVESKAGLLNPCLLMGMV